MGNKRPTEMEDFKIRKYLQIIKYQQEWIKSVDNIEGFFNAVNSLHKTFAELSVYGKKYPNFFNPNPVQTLKNFSTHKLVFEKNFIDRYIVAIEKRLLNYSTARGKINNFNKMVDIFRYYAGEFEPENVNYFEMKLKERFPNFLQ